VPEERTDTQLLIASRTEPEAFTELYRRHAEDLLRYFARRTLDPETAAELTAETFAEAFASRATYRDQGVNGVAWLYGIARHRLGRFFRSGRVDAAARRKLGMPERDLPSEDYERIEDLIGLGYAEVAERLECTEQNARQRVSRGLKKLALLLQERGMQLTTEVEA
jgi:DNA-directed RNA polymerase specialized sigma24 family protein